MLQRTKYEGEMYARLSIIVESDSKYIPIGLCKAVSASGYAYPA